MQEEIMDYRLQHWLQAKISTLPYSQQIQLRNLKLCNWNTIKQAGAVPAVFLLHNGTEAKFFGHVSCKNAWACPVCSAKVMSKYASNIGDIIDALDDKGYFGFMMTFTIPHLAFESCRNVTDRLLGTWKRMISGCADNKYNPYHKFKKALGVKWNIRVMEYTWGKNGWHPHYHALFFIPKGRQNEVLAWEESLSDYWIKICKGVTSRMYEDDVTEQIFSATTKTGYHNGITISRDDKGKLRRALSSEYICGWGANSEVTGNYRKQASHENHYTPHQILEMASHGNKEMEKLYIEFCLEVTRKPVKCRMKNSQGLKKILNEWRQQGKARSYAISKKKAESQAWRVVCWFTSEQWSELCYKNLYSPILSNILWIAVNARELLEEFLAYYDIYLVQTEHFHSRHVENIFNRVYEAG